MKGKSIEILTEVNGLMYYRLLLVVVVFASIVPAGPLMAQKLKIPSLLPFKKQTQEVKPFQLTDQSKGKPGVFPNGPIMKFLHPSDSPGSGHSLAEFNERSKGFFAKTGESISKFATDTRIKLKGHESPGWDYREQKHWWNQAGHEPDRQALLDDYNQILQMQAHPLTPAPLPPPRTARDFQNDSPLHRF